jgi:HemY protein
LDVADGKTAAREIETYLRKTWSDDLIDKYGKFDFSDEAQQLAHAEGWLTARPNNSVLLLALGRISMRNKLWEKAREYFEASSRIYGSAEVYGELSRLTKGLGDFDASEKYFASYVELIGDGLPKLPMPEILDKKAS